MKFYEVMAVITLSKNTLPGHCTPHDDKRLQYQIEFESWSTQGMYIILLVYI